MDLVDQDQLSEDHRAIRAELEEEAEAELRAEFQMSWVCGGGDPLDAGVAYSTYRGGY